MKPAWLFYFEASLAKTPWHPFFFSGGDASAPNFHIPRRSRMGPWDLCVTGSASWTDCVWSHLYFCILFFIIWSCVYFFLMPFSSFNYNSMNFEWTGSTGGPLSLTWHKVFLNRLSRASSIDIELYIFDQQVISSTHSRGSTEPIIWFRIFSSPDFWVFRMSARISISILPLNDAANPKNVPWK